MTDTDHAAVLAAWLSRIEAMHPAEIELGLGRLARVAAQLEVAALPMPVITVAGTNGKGSTLQLIKALAEQAGQRLCLYTSPHLLRFNERIVLPDGEASDQAICQAFEQVDRARGDTPLTYFEFTTLAALWLFRRSGADLVLLEVGLGGRLDAVNLIDPTVSVVTSVGLDHQDWLGNTREAICAEKCGIARSGRPLVYGETDWPGNLLEQLASRGAQPILASRDFNVQGGAIHLADGSRRVCPDSVLLGQDNLATACQALALAGVPVSDGALARVASLTLRGRCEYRRLQGADCWFDVGHNLAAVTRFHDLLPACDGQRHLVLGMMSDKPLAHVAGVFVGEQAQWYLCAPALPRAATVEQLAAAIPGGETCHRPGTVAAAFNEALSAAKPGDQVVVFGSFFTVAEAWLAVEEGQGE